MNNTPRLLSETRILAGTSAFDQQANSDRPGVTRPSGIFGGNVLNRQDREESKVQAVQNLTVLEGAHTLKFGLDVARSRTRIATDFHPNGTFLYNSDRAFEAGDCGFGVSALEAQNSLHLQLSHSYLLRFGSTSDRPVRDRPGSVSAAGWPRE